MNTAINDVASALGRINIAFSHIKTSGVEYNLPVMKQEVSNLYNLLDFVRFEEQKANERRRNETEEVIKNIRDNANRWQ